jgi:3-hydroxyisobutyrate dehydrogenase-like beta-hydroxyacid dehydrogenase
LSRTFEVKVDPGVMKDGTSVADLVDQQNFLLNLRVAMNDAAAARLQLQQVMQKAGVQPEALLEAVRGGSFGQGNILSRVVPNVVFTGDFDTQQFALRLARKDVGLATELAREFDVPMTLIPLVEQLMVEAVARGWGERDSNASWELQEERAGVKVRASK